MLVLLAGSALAINYADEHAGAILYAGYPGAQGGKAIARLLFGDVSPEGKLPITFYRTTEELPAFTDYSMKGRTYRYMKQEALYPFGYGLSYSTFSLSNTSVSCAEVTEAGIDVETTVSNDGEFDGAEVIQIYVKVTGEDTPNPQLKGFRKVFLKKGEKAVIRLHLPAEAFGLYDETGRKKLTKGECLLYVGTAQPDTRSQALTGRKQEPIHLHVGNTEYIS